MLLETNVTSVLSAVMILQMGVQVWSTNDIIKFEKPLLFHCQHFLSKQTFCLACNYCKYLQNVSVMKKDPHLLVVMILETVPANQGLKAKNVMNARMDLIHFQIVTLVKTNTTVIQIANVRFITFHQNIRLKNHVSFHSLSVWNGWISKHGMWCYYWRMYMQKY